MRAFLRGGRLLRFSAAALLLYVLFWNAPALRAAFTAAYDQMISARMAGSGGAWVAGQLSSDNALGNPAALSPRLGSDLLVSGGNLSNQNAELGAAILSLPIDPGLSVALANSDLLQSGDDGYLENSSSVAAALLLAPWLRFGARYNFDHLVSPAAANNGSSIDLGLRSEFSWEALQTWALGAEIDNLISSWDDPDVAASVPIRVKGGLSWHFAKGPGTWVGSEIEEIIPSSPALMSLTVLKIGLEQALPDNFVARMGSSSDPSARYDFGAGWKGGDLGVDSALILSDQGNYSLRLEVSWAFPQGSAPSVSVAPLEIRYVPGTKKIQDARIALDVPISQNAEAWQLEIRDKNGNVIRVIEGIGTPPGSVNWDGKDKNGLWVNDGDQVSYHLSIKTPDNQSSFQPLLSGDLNLPGGDLLPLEISGVSKSAALPALLPVYGADGKSIEHFLIRMPESSGPVSKWTVEVRNAEGLTLQTIQGTGPLPAELAWDGKSKEGMKISDPSGLNIRLVSLDMNGKPTEILGTVYTQPGLSLDWGEDQQVRLKIRENESNATGVHAWALDVVPSNLAPLPVLSPSPSPSIPPNLGASPTPGIEIASSTPTLTENPTLLPNSPAPSSTEVSTPIPNTPSSTWTTEPTPVPYTPSATWTVEPSPVPATFSPTSTATAFRTPTEIPSATFVPLLRQSVTEIPISSPSDTAITTVIPTPSPSPIPREKVYAPIRVHSQLSGERLAFVFMPSENPEPAPAPQRPLSPEFLKRIRAAKVPMVLDVFESDQSVESKRLLPRLDQAYERYRGIGFHLIRLTGLLQIGEKGGYELSRARAIRVSALLNQKGYHGEFVIWVDATPGPQKGVRIEVLH